LRPSALTGHAIARTHGARPPATTPTPRRRFCRAHPLLVPPTVRRQGAELYAAMFLPPAGKLQQQTSPAADACTTSSGRLIITDRTSKDRFLLDTDSDLCVFLRKLVPGHKERVNYDLFAANGTTVPTYGRISLSPNLGLRRDFAWRFMVADVQTPHHRRGPTGPLRSARRLPEQPTRRRNHIVICTGPNRAHAYPQRENRRRRRTPGQPPRRVP
jgi:hypothetical protein